MEAVGPPTVRAALLAAAFLAPDPLPGPMAGSAAAGEPVPGADIFIEQTDDEPAADPARPGQPAGDGATALLSVSPDCSAVLEIAGESGDERRRITPPDGVYETAGGRRIRVVEGRVPGCRSMDLDHDSARPVIRKIR
jgi:hypothetical protein